MKKVVIKIEKQIVKVKICGLPIIKKVSRFSKITDTPTKCLVALCDAFGLETTNVLNMSALGYPDLQ